MPRTMIDAIREPGALRIEFQPIVTVRENAVELYAAEALTRGPRGTSMERPDVLFEYARRKGQETQVDLVCIAAALASSASLPEGSHLTINVHASTLSGVPHFIDKLLTAAKAYEIASERLILEIVEHRAPWCMKSLHATLAELRAEGVRIALDDLGVGASNYRMVIDCHPDLLKIDRYIVDGCSDDPWRVSVLRSIVTLAEACGAKPIAEGVERSDDLDVLLQLGIDTVQGWLFGASMPAQDIARHMKGFRK